VTAVSADADPAIFDVPCTYIVNSSVDSGNLRVKLSFLVMLLVVQMQACLFTTLPFLSFLLLRLSCLSLFRLVYAPGALTQFSTIFLAPWHLFNN